MNGWKKADLGLKKTRAEGLGLRAEKTRTEGGRRTEVDFFLHASFRNLPGLRRESGKFITWIGL